MIITLIYTLVVILIASINFSSIIEKTNKGIPINDRSIIINLLSIWLLLLYTSILTLI